MFSFLSQKCLFAVGMFELGFKHFHALHLVDTSFKSFLLCNRNPLLNTIYLLKKPSRSLTEFVLILDLAFPVEVS